MIRAAGMAAVSLFSILATLNLIYGFYLWDGIRYSLHRDGFHVVGYHGEKDGLDLPESRLGISVVQIDAGTFQGNENLVSVTIPAAEKGIEDFAFNDCERLMEVTLNEGGKAWQPMPLETAKACRWW